MTTIHPHIAEPNSFEAALEEQIEAAAKRVSNRTEQRQQRIDTLKKPGGIAWADDPERVATRIDRLSRFYPDVRPISPAAIATQDEDAMWAAGAVLERIINAEDFLDVRFLQGGAVAARAVGRVNIRDERGRLAGYGTGSLVSPSLLLTNHHVLESADVARASTIEFDYEDGVDGRPLQPRIYSFDPDRFFLNDKTLDFALVAVSGPAGELAAFGFNRLISAEGKAIVGDFVTIIQHPRGEKKQVALRENQIVDVADRFLHYETDTEPGSSGSPVFNDEWEVVGLHHASVAAPSRKELGGIVNEGVRTSRLMKFIRDERYSSDEQPLVDQLLQERIAVGSLGASVQVAAAAPPVNIGTQALHLTVPLEISVGSNGGGTAKPLGSVEEAINIDPDYSKRKGYDRDFLGAGHRVPLPTLPDDLVPSAAINSMATGEPRHVLPYTHFSVVLNKDRGLAFFTAVNIDGDKSNFEIKRERDRWFFDPRLPQEVQTGEDVYRSNPLDRGHLVRRLDPAWGRSRTIAKAGNDDTFHFTNCTPQHEDFNQNQTTWAGLENYILENADNHNLKVSVFTGPVLAEDDDSYEGVKLPRQFWKVVTMVKNTGELSATAYLLSQKELIEGLEFLPEAFSYGAYKTYQVPVRQIEDLTRLSFGSLSESDPLARFEAAVAPKEIEHLDQLEL